MRCAVLVGLAGVISVSISTVRAEKATGQSPRESVYASQATGVSGSFQTTANGNLVAHFASSGGGPHTIAVIDPVKQVLGVYHVDTASGAITLKSVRNLTWDLQMIQFNSEGPSPQDVRGGLRSATLTSGAESKSQRVRTTETEVSRRGPVAAPVGG